MDWSQLPELVKDTELNTRFEPGYTIHESAEDPHPFATRRQEVWKRVRTIGQGGFSYVRLEECVRRQDEGTPQKRAVKVIRLTRESDIKLFSRELEATAKFSQKKVSYTACVPFTH
jgi:serine/threonine protein kinase